MKIEDNPLIGLFEPQKISQDVVNDDAQFSAILEQLHKPNPLEEVPLKDTPNDNVEQFLEKVNKHGAAHYLADMNMKKIEALVKEYEDKLIASMGDSPEARQEISQRVSTFKKQLIEDLEKQLSNQSDSLSLDTDTVINTILTLKEAKTSPLQRLLEKE
jgi:hypothetical protein